MKPETACRRLLENFQQRRLIRASSLITTVFGDTVAPRGGSVWLGSLIRAMHSFGLSERLVRTSVFRLARDGWLESRQIGRRSYYGLTSTGAARFEVATHRIYATPDGRWDGRWTLLLLGSLDAEQKELARREFGWQGFAALSSNVLAHPAPDDDDLGLTIDRLGLGDSLIVMRGEALMSTAAVDVAVARAWNTDALNQRYRRFIEQFSPSLRAVRSGRETPPDAAFVLRTLLVQEYRKILLRDPRLPAALLPADWQGQGAWQMCSNLYRAVYARADRYIDEVLENEHGPLPPNAPSFHARFGGLE